MDTTIDNSYMIMHILNNITSAYDSIVKNLENRLDVTTNPLTLEILRDKLPEKHEKLRRERNSRMMIMKLITKTATEDSSL